MVKRYDIADDDGAGDVSMMEFEDGEYVTFAEYDALAARLAEAERLLQAVYSDSSDDHMKKEIARFLSTADSAEPRETVTP